MKKILFLIMVMFNLTVFSQVKSNYEMIYNNDTCVKSFLYSKSRMYIADIFKSAKDVIQNEDKEFGAIFCRGTNSINGYYFDFTLKIRVKDGITKITISDIYNSSAPYKYSILKINNFQGIWKNNMTKKQYNRIMFILDRDMNNILISYINYMKSKEENF